MLRGDTCRLLACDFDGPGWALDALAYLDAARAARVSAYLERSRSGDGGHVWVFFTAPVPAAAARRIGAHLVREAMTVRAELDLASYDRLFPAQDFMPKGSFGNLIALPLQGERRKQDTTVFLDPASLEPYEDQWAFLSSVERLTPDVVGAMATTFGDVAMGPDAPTFRRPLRRAGSPRPPSEIAARTGAMLQIDRIGVPPALLSVQPSSTLPPCTTLSSTRRSGCGSRPGKRRGSSAATGRRSTRCCSPGGCATRRKRSSARPAAIFES